MKKVNYEDLGVLFGTKANEYFNTDVYSKLTTNYSEDIKEDNYNEETGLSKCYIELTYYKSNKPPLLIYFYSQDVYDSNGNIIDIKFYID
jgi:hypothetical protein